MNIFEIRQSGDSKRLLAKWIRQYHTFDEFSDTGLKTPTRVMLQRLRSFDAGHNYVIREVPTSSITPSQHGEDYDNDSSRHSAKAIANNEIYREEDLLPIIVDRSGAIQDGNHRHAAATMNNQDTMYALFPTSPGNGNIINLEEFYNSFK